MNTTVLKSELITKVCENKDRHKEHFEEALAAYFVKATELCLKGIEDLKKKRKTNLYISLSPPEDHTREYEVLLDMLYMSVDETITLDFEQFECYVRDEWEWSRGWYVGSSGLTGPTGSMGPQGDTGVSGTASSRGYI